MTLDWDGGGWQHPCLRWYLSPYNDLYDLMQKCVGHGNGLQSLARVDGDGGGIVVSIGNGPVGTSLFMLR